MNVLTFLNHASFVIQQESELLLIDPWFEGNAFFNGWALLDKQITNDLAIDYLKKTYKAVFIWYSHEHSDHFSISFLKKLKISGLFVTFIFQKTVDQRVVNFLRNESFKVIECNDGESIKLNDNFAITTWAYHSGDSYCLIQSHQTSILNINDCEIDSLEAAKKVLNKIKNKTVSIDILFTQFGYANWIGNEEDNKLRKVAATEKLKQMSNQIRVFMPKFLIPFASFVYFCNKENFYLNDFQNSPNSIRDSDLLNSYQEFIFFMKPWDEVDISNTIKLKNSLNILTNAAEDHWNNLKDNQNPIDCNVVLVSQNKIKEAFKIFWLKITFNFIFIPQFLEMLGVIKPLSIFIIDLNTVAQLSYLRGIAFIEHSGNWSISLHSEVFEFILKNDFGFNTTHVNGRYRAKNYECHLMAQRFFSPQEYQKKGFGIFRPLASAKALFMLLGKSYSRG